MDCGKARDMRIMAGAKGSWRLAVCSLSIYESRDI